MARRKLTEDESIAILQRGKMGVLSMVETAGTAYAVPINYVFDARERAIYLHCAKKGRKIDAMRSHPQVAFTVVGGSEIVEERYITRYESVLVQGDATLIEDLDEKRRVLQLLCSILTPSAVTRRDTVIEKSLPAVGIVKITMNSISGKVNDGIE